MGYSIRVRGSTRISFAVLLTLGFVWRGGGSSSSFFPVCIIFRMVGLICDRVLIVLCAPAFQSSELPIHLASFERRGFDRFGCITHRNISDYRANRCSIMFFNPSQTQGGRGYRLVLPSGTFWCRVCSCGRGTEHSVRPVSGRLRSSHGVLQRTA